MLPPDFADAVADPPHVHPVDGGVAYTEQSCYQFVAAHVGEGSTTLEAGLGLSTIAFALLRCNHTAVFLDPEEGNAFTRWAQQRDIDLSTVALCGGGSERVLPTFEFDALDLLFIDGNQGYPYPQFDFLYAGSHLKRGASLSWTTSTFGHPVNSAAT